MSNSVDWIITTGGTGFGVRDKTPEVRRHLLKRLSMIYEARQAVTPLLEREASGLVHLLLSSSLRHTPLAALSRPVAGTVKDTLVVTLPGSVKAVKESLEALLTGGVIEHAIELIKGGSGKAVHSAMSTTGQDPYHHHHEGHHVPKPRTVLSHDPSGSGTVLCVSNGQLNSSYSVNTTSHFSLPNHFFQRSFRNHPQDHCAVTHAPTSRTFDLLHWRG